METGIYMIRNKVNDKKYIGQAVDIDKRWREHKGELNDNKHYNSYLQRAWNKYGADKFEFTIICQCLEQDLDRLEIHYIAHFDTYNNGYNLTLGGDGTKGYKWTDEQLARRGESLKETMSRPEVKKKHRERVKEAMNRPEVKKKQREALNRPEVKKKMSESMKGKNTGPMSEKTKAKISEAVKKAVYCVTNNTIYESCKEAGDKLDIDRSSISYCCKGKNTRVSSDGHYYKKGRFKDSPVYEFWHLSEYEEKFGKVAI